MAMALNKSTDGGTTFQQVSLSVADYTTGGVISDIFTSIKDSKNNVYIICQKSSQFQKMPIIKIDSNGVKTVSLSTAGTWAYRAYVNCNPVLSRDEKTLFYCADSGSGSVTIYKLNVESFATTYVETSMGLPTVSSSAYKFAIYKDQYIWVASGTTVKIYDYDTKVELASVSMGSISSFVGICCDINNVLYSVTISGATNWMTKVVFNGVNTLTNIGITNAAVSVNKTQWKQMLLDRFGDLIILTNSGTASTLLKYSNTGTLIDTVSLSVGTNKGAYGLQVYSSDNGTKCWVQFGNDLGTWRTAAKSYDAIPANRIFGAVSKIRDNGVTTYGDDHGGDNNYSVRC